MSWMVKWPGDFPVFVERAAGAHFTCVDEVDHIDLCLGDTGAMMGHSPAATVEAVTRQLSRGITTMLPTEDAIAVSTGLAQRFGLPYWQFTLTATDANRHAIRYARMLTGRSKVVVHNWCYHGSVDEAFATLGAGAHHCRPVPATSEHRSTPPRRRASWSSTTWRRWSELSRTATSRPSSSSRR